MCTRRKRARVVRRQGNLGQDELIFKKFDARTTELNQDKKSRKFNSIHGENAEEMA